MAISDERDLGMGSGQSEALVIGKRGRHMCAYGSLWMWCDGGTAESCEGTRTGELASSMNRERKKRPHLSQYSKPPALGSGGFLGVLVSLSLGHLCMAETI